MFTLEQLKNLYMMSELHVDSYLPPEQACMITHLGLPAIAGNLCAEMRSYMSDRFTALSSEP